MMKIYKYAILLLMLALLPACSTKQVVTEETKTAKQEIKVTDKKQNSLFTFIDDIKNKRLTNIFPSRTKVESYQIDSANKVIEITFSRDISNIPLRNENVNNFYNVVKEKIKNDYPDYQIKLSSLGHKLEELIPNFYRGDKNTYDKNRLSKNPAKAYSVVYNLSRPNQITKGLVNRNIVVWQSHGWYYEPSEKRWVWQRPRLFQSVEDKVPLSFVVPYLLPMLENAGANVFDPRERDYQTNEAIVDNDVVSKSYMETAKNKSIFKTGKPGFALGTIPYYDYTNPFKQGSFRYVNSESKESAAFKWIPTIPEDGYYGVYISFNASPDNVKDADYTVNYSGGKTHFKVDQTIGGSTWIYLGRFLFKKGMNESTGSVVLTNKSSETGKIVSADAVRFGGGMGMIARDSSVSGRPRYIEAGRYWLQFAGMPDSSVYTCNMGKNEYNDDYQSRSEYANYLKGAPFGPNKNRNDKGCGIPIDLSMAFHTDAGITTNDTTVGTLSIYSLEGYNKEAVFPDGQSRLANRDLADIVQTEITHCLRSKWDSTWSRRDLREAQYSESVRSNMPDLLLELLSHQNFLDMKFVLDPRFRFDVARSIYKGMLKFLSVQNNVEYTVQPLPVDHFSTEINAGGNILLKWKPVDDPLEPTAKATKYIVYTRINDEGFDSGTLVDNSSYEFANPKKGVIYGFKVTAVNDGGESFPSEILSACINNGQKPVLIVNAFNRISAPGTVETPTYSGFTSNLDAGVPDKFDFITVGMQNDFNPKSDFITNDAPGWGASSAELETFISAGNTFDYPYVHGLAFKDNGFSFVSCSDESVMDNEIKLNGYNFVDFIYGKEKTTHYQKPFGDAVNGVKYSVLPPALRTKVQDYLLAGGKALFSGSYIASDLSSVVNGDSSGYKFAKDILKIKLGAKHAVNTGAVMSVTDTKVFGKKLDMEFNTKYDKNFYIVEAPESISPEKGAETFLRYKENSFSAGVIYNKEYSTAVIGFPLETIKDKTVLSKLIKELMLQFKL